MNEIIVAFPKKEIAINIRNILVRGGMDVYGVCTTGAQVLHIADTLDEGIIICGYRMQDMMYTDIREYLPKEFDILLVTSPDKWSDGSVQGVIGLSMPIKVHDLINTVEMMLQNMRRRRKKRHEAAKQRSPEEKALIAKAKSLLMDRNNMTEEEAHRYLQKSSMDSGTNMLETAQMVLTIMDE